MKVYVAYSAGDQNLQDPPPTPLLASPIVSPRVAITEGVQYNVPLACFSSLPSGTLPVSVPGRIGRGLFDHKRLIRSI